MYQNNNYLAGAHTLHELFFDNQRENWAVTIPNYQRPFKWKAKEQVKALLDSIYTNFIKLASHADRTTFLGSIIFAEEIKKGRLIHAPVDIVDGQQRLTTLTLLSSVLIIELQKLKDQTLEEKSLDESLENLLVDEIDEIVNSLERFIFINFKKGRTEVPAPRLLRWVDSLGEDRRNSEFKSPLAKLLFKLSGIEQAQYKDFEFPEAIKSTDEGSSIYEVYEYFQNNLIPELSNEEHMQIEFEYDVFELKNAKRNQYSELFKTGDKNGISQLISKIEQIGSVHLAQTIRVLLFSNFLMHKCVVAFISSSSQSTAFDIFDALNTTGIPLTAIETLKPQVVQYYRDINNHSTSFEGSDAEASFNAIDEIFARDFPETSQQERETKLLTSLAGLYLEGKKIAANLSAQRLHLREWQDKANNLKKPDLVISSIHTLLNFRNTFFRKNGIDGFTFNQVTQEKLSEIKLLSSVFFESKKLLVAAPLCRFYEHAQQNSQLDNYISVLRALTAFTILRRAATGGTSGIDSIYRKMMDETGLSICTDFDANKILPNVSDVKEFLVENLKSNELAFGLNNKVDWVNHVAAQPLYKHSTIFLKFLLFAAHHGTKLDETEPGLVTRDGVTASTSREFLSYEVWNRSIYSTLEHIAPQTNSSSDWKDVHSNPHSIHSLGNFTLVPGQQNSNLGNATWAAKKCFFEALSSNDKNIRTNKLNQAKNEGMSISASRFSELENDSASELLKGLSDANEWNLEFVTERSKRLAGLSWDTLIHWLV